MDGRLGAAALPWCYVPCPARGPHQHQASKHLSTIVTLTNSLTNHQPTTPTYLPTNPTNHHHHPPTSTTLTNYLLTYYDIRTYIHRMYVYVPRTARTAPTNDQPTNWGASYGCAVSWAPTYQPRQSAVRAKVANHLTRIEYEYCRVRNQVCNYKCVI